MGDDSDNSIIDVGCYLFRLLSCRKIIFSRRWRGRKFKFRVCFKFSFQSFIDHCNSASHFIRFVSAVTFAVVTAFAVVILSYLVRFCDLLIRKIICIRFWSKCRHLQLLIDKAATVTELRFSSWCWRYRSNAPLHRNVCVTRD